MSGLKKALLILVAMAIMICTAFAQSAWSDDQNLMMADKDPDVNHTTINASINASAIVPYLMKRDCNEPETNNMKFGNLIYAFTCQRCQWYELKSSCTDCCPPKGCSNQWVPVGDPTDSCSMRLMQIG